MQPIPSPAGHSPGQRREMPAAHRRLLDLMRPLRFVAAGGIATAINWAVRFPISLVVPFDAAVALAYGVGMVVGFVLYRAWVFEGSTLPLRQQIWRFVAVNAAGLGVVMLGSGTALSALDALDILPRGWRPGAAHAAALILGAVVNYLGHRTLTFARRASPSLSAGRSARP